MAERDDLGSFLSGFIVGGTIGAVVALLMAPQSGEETRTMIKEKGIELKDKTTASLEDAYARAEEAAADARSRADELAKVAKQRADELKQRITGMSYPEQGSDIIGYDDLNYIELLYYDFDGQVKEGELIVNVRVAQEVTEIFYELYKAQYPFESVVLVDDFGEPGNDSLSMAANNTSGFNYRTVVGSEKLSRHSYGAAIDVSPVLNPYIDGDRIAPENGKPYIDRTQDVPGIIDHDDLCYQLFIAHGWVWGGDWPDSKDYQHFSKDLGYDT